MHDGRGENPEHRCAARRNDVGPIGPAGGAQLSLLEEPSRRVCYIPSTILSPFIFNFTFYLFIFGREEEKHWCARET